MKKFIPFTILLSILIMSTFNSCTSSEKKATTGEELVIVAHVKAKPEYKEDLIKAFEKVVDATRKEPGNVSYELFEDINNPLNFTFVEVWKSPTAIEEHSNSAHFQEFAKSIDGKADLSISTLKQKF